jgi:hypothetical protein
MSPKASAKSRQVVPIETKIAPALFQLIRCCHQAVITPVLTTTMTMKAR